MRSATWREFATNTSGPAAPARSCRRSRASSGGSSSRVSAPDVLALEEALLPRVAHGRVAVADVQRAAGGVRTFFAHAWLLERTRSKPDRSNDRNALFISGSSLG